MEYIISYILSGDMMYFILSKKTAVLLCMFFGVGLLFGSFLVFRSYAGKNRDLSELSVIIDAGHGLPDGGAVGVSGIVEQDINLKIAEKVREALEAKGITVIMTRETENGLSTKKSRSIREMKIEDMRKRMSIMKKSDADLFISIHMNSYKNGSASGLRIFYAQNYEDIKPLAENIQLRMADVTGAKTSVVKTADKSLFLLKNPPLPSILVECGFLSNPIEEEKLASADYQSRLAWAIADAIEKYYALQTT